MYPFDQKNQRFQSPLLYKTKTKIKFILMTLYPKLAFQNYVIFKIFKKTGSKFGIN